MDIEELRHAESGIGKRIRQIRRDKDLSQEELAALAGTTQAVIQKIENGKSKRPRNLAEIAVAPQVNPAWLQWGEPYAMDFTSLATVRPGGI